MSTIDQAEIEHFEQTSSEWWNENGAYKPLHKLTPMRMEYICGQIDAHFNISDRAKYKDLSVLDIGCGGGLACEPLARLGAKVTGLDASEKNIATALTHARESDLDIEYFPMSSEDYLAKDKQHDVVLALEIVEHVADLDLFIESCTKLVKPGGLIILSTLNRTAKSFALGIVAAEYILRWVPQGTHTWSKFLRPSELAKTFATYKYTPADITGVRYNPLNDTFSLDKNDLDVNYFMAFVN